MTEEEKVKWMMSLKVGDTICDGSRHRTIIKLEDLSAMETNFTLSIMEKIYKFGPGYMFDKLSKKFIGETQDFFKKVSRKCTDYEERIISLLRKHIDPKLIKYNLDELIVVDRQATLDNGDVCLVFIDCFPVDHLEHVHRTTLDPTLN